MIASLPSFIVYFLPALNVLKLKLRLNDLYRKRGAASGNFVMNLINCYIGLGS